MEDFGDFISRTMKTCELDAPPPVAKEPPEDLVLKRLRKHKFYKAVIRCTTGSPVRRRVTVSRFTPDLLETYQQTRGHVKRSEDDLIANLKSLRDEMNDLRNKHPRNTLAERVSFRKTLDKIGDVVHWLRNKPARNIIEEKYLRKGLVQGLKESFFSGTPNDTCRDAYNYLVNISQPGDKFVSQETVGLHVLDEYLLKNDEDLFEILSSLDQLNTGTIEWSTFANALQKGKVPLETFEILQSITVMDCNHNDGVKYQDFCKRMANFRNYKWNRIMLNDKSICKNLLKEIDDAKYSKLVIDPRYSGSKRLKATLKSDRAVTNIPDTLKELIKKPRQRSKAQVTDRKRIERICMQEESWDDKPVRGKIKNKFWPGALLDKLRPCYMPMDRRPPNDRQHPLFEIIRPETPVKKPAMKLPPFARYTIYGNDKEI